MPDREMVTETLAEDDIVGSCNTLVELIAELQAALAKVPEDFRGSATLNIHAYDWCGSDVTYERPITDEEIATRNAVIERQRLSAAKHANTRAFDEWIRNIRMHAGMQNRDEAIAFIQTDPEANKFHPDVFCVRWAT